MSSCFGRLWPFLGCLGGHLISGSEGESDSVLDACMLTYCLLYSNALLRTPQGVCLKAAYG